MYKSLLLLSAAMTTAAAASAQAQDASVESFDRVTVFNGAYSSQISANGKWMAGAMLDMASVVDVENRTIYVDHGSFELGCGTSVSDVGVIAANIDRMGGRPGYFNMEKWHELPTGGYPGFVRAISNDGRTIAGLKGTGISQGDEGISYVPVLWHASNVDSSESFTSDPEVLPYPEKDFTGRPPMMISAIGMSADGSVILGQVWEYFGQVSVPLVWTRNADGNWEYKLYYTEHLNPAGLQFPEWPGDSPESPDYYDYMTAEQRAEYDEALNEWMINGYDPFEYPEPTDYMSEEQAAKYEQDMTAYQEAIIPWDEKYEAFMKVYWEVRNNPDFSCTMINSGKMNPQGTYFIADWTHTGQYPEGTLRFDLQNDETEAVKIPFELGQILEDGSMTGRISGNPLLGTPDIAYVWPADGEAMTLFDYFRQTNPKLAEWMDEYMCQTYFSGLDEQEHTELFSGFPSATNGLKQIATGVYNTWGEVDDMGELLEGHEAYAYLFEPENYLSGIGDVMTGAVMMRVNGGVITISGDAETLEVHDTNGMPVISARHPGTRVDTGLKGGIYVVKATSKSGVKTVMKARF